MADLTTTQLKLRTTPTAGVSSEQSPYYRRLLSAGYKGFLQGTVGGSTLYGAIGAAIGACAALPLAPFTGGLSLWLIPGVAALGVYKGASTFGNIGSLAAITAESAEMSEKRRYLLDRYYDLPDTPEFDEEAAQIRDLLAKQHESKVPQHMFHGRAVMVGAALGVGAALLLTLVAPGSIAIAGHFIFGEALAAAGMAGHTLLATAAGALLGGLSGAVIGLDRYYVRSWLDKSASVMHDSRSIEEQIIEREREVEQLGVRSGTPNLRNVPAVDVPKILPPQNDEAMKINIAEPQGPSRAVDESHPHGATKREVPIDPRQIAGLSEIKHEGRISAEKALDRPVL